MDAKWEKTKRTLQVVGILDLIATYVWPILPTGVTVVTGFYIDELPVSVLIVLSLAAFGLAVWIKNQIQTPNANIQAKRDVLQRLCSVMYQMTDSWDGKNNSASAVLNEIAMVFSESKDVQKQLDRLREGQAHLSRDLPDLISAMAAAANVKLDSSNFKKPLYRKPPEAKE